ncbi:D-tyrosyl-tRNA(Tyr) deacylase-like [Dorcoceras hygrometricum]|uniref:D-aminoacyl-tRNA deacylase n=1 Tax=Dorcoceras hygrometricum TaxID=472368 RepID=A0A2Z7CXN1_9LAMI|nr:D-tyrosyl-tRNA(Tyr) deacylase-like [Dorcoceras hygrometricum]
MFSSNDIGLIPFECRNLFLRNTQLHAVTVRRNRRNPFSPGSRKRKIESMRAVVQRVASASVEVEGRPVSAIGPGLLVLVGLHETDVESDAEYICRKVLNMRLFPNEKTGKNWDQNVQRKRCFNETINLKTCAPTITNGRMKKTHASKIIVDAKFLRFAILDRLCKEIMKFCWVNLVNDGPVTMQLDSAQSSKNPNCAVETL